jgi:cell wall-associated NlpC family hydrolase
MELAGRHADIPYMRRRGLLWRAAVVFALSALTGACASSRAVPRPFPVPSSTAGNAARPDAAAVAAEPPATAGDRALIETALSLRGVPYRNGGSDPKGFDCSGFTQYVYAQFGLALPRETRDQFDFGMPVGSNEVMAGDLLFFATVAPGPTHVAIAIGGDRFVHAPSSTGVVRIERLSTSYWAGRYVGARRVMPL